MNTYVSMQTGLIWNHVGGINGLKVIESWFL
jgi:hypothetical protein